MKTLQEQYNKIQEGKGSKEVFMKDAKRQFPNLVRNAAGFNETANQNPRCRRPQNRGQSQ